MDESLWYHYATNRERRERLQDIGIYSREMIVSKDGTVEKIFSNGERLRYKLPPPFHNDDDMRAITNMTEQGGRRNRHGDRMGRSKIFGGWQMGVKKNKTAKLTVLQEETMDSKGSVKPLTSFVLAQTPSEYEFDRYIQLPCKNFGKVAEKPSKTNIIPVVPSKPSSESFDVGGYNEQSKRLVSSAEADDSSAHHELEELPSGDTFELQCKKENLLRIHEQQRAEAEAETCLMMPSSYNSFQLRCKEENLLRRHKQQKAKTRLMKLEIEAANACREAGEFRASLLADTDFGLHTATTEDVKIGRCRHWQEQSHEEPLVQGEFGFSVSAVNSRTVSKPVMNYGNDLESVQCPAALKVAKEFVNEIRESVSRGKKTVGSERANTEIIATSNVIPPREMPVERIIEAISQSSENVESIQDRTIGDCIGKSIKNAKEGKPKEIHEVRTDFVRKTVKPFKNREIDLIITIDPPTDDFDCGKSSDRDPKMEAEVKKKQKALKSRMSSLLRSLRKF